MTEREVPEDVRLLMERIGFPPDRVAQNCHVVSHAIVQSGIYPGARVARGSCFGVIGQHSWVVADYGREGVYDENAHIIDATLWSYDEKVTGVWQGTMHDGRHRPHGMGHLFDANRPTHHGGVTIPLSVEAQDRLGASAVRFLDMIGPLDLRGWHDVAHLPVGGWPAREVIEAMLDTPALAALVPIDIVGHLTDRNPGGLYIRSTNVV